MKKQLFKILGWYNCEDARYLELLCLKCKYTFDIKVTDSTMATCPNCYNHEKINKG